MLMQKSDHKKPNEDILTIVTRVLMSQKCWVKRT